MAPAPESEDVSASVDSCEAPLPLSPAARNRDAELSATLLLEAGEIENRLRKHVLSLVEPCINRQTMFDIRLKELRANVDKLTASIEGTQKLSEGAESVKGMVESFRAQLAEWDAERKGHEQTVGLRLSSHDTELNGLRQTLERKAVDISASTRALKGLTESLAMAQEQTTELRRYCSERLDVNRDKLSKLRDEFETRQMSVENQQHRLQDHLTSMEMVINQMKAHLERMENDVAGVVESVADLGQTKASITQVEEQQHEFAEFGKQLNAHVASLREQFSGLVSDVKAHFQTAAQVVGTSTAKQMDEMREKYGVDAAQVSGSLKEMDGIVESQRIAVDGMRNDLAQVQEGAAKQLGELREALEVQGQRREAEGKSLALEVAVLRGRIEQLQRASREDSGGGNPGNDVLSLLVESELLSTMLDLQDDQDRRNISLFGFKGGDGKQAPYPALKEDGLRGWSLPELEASAGAAGRRAGAPQAPRAPAAADVTKTPRRRAVASPAAAVGEAPGTPVMTIDKRCLSCSGSTATVLAGFKMACLQYAPSPVVYHQAPHSRSELIRLRMDLLNQAKEQLRSIE